MMQLLRRFNVGRRLGLLIGINQYQHSAFLPLQFAENDAKALAQWLVNSRGGNWIPSDVQLVLGSQATSELAEALIKQVCVNVAEPDDLVFIYFGGHAFVDEASGDGYLALANTRYEQPATGMHLMSLVRHALVRSRAAQIVLILDCFQTGPIWSMRRTSPFDFKPLLGPTLQSGLQQTQGRVLYCSCRGNEYVPEASEKKLGTLLYRMILGLSGRAADPASGQITLQQLHTYLSSSLDQQHQPQLFGRDQRPIVLVGDMPSFAPLSPQEQGYVNVAVAASNSGGAQPSMSSQLAGTASAQMSPSTSGQISLSTLDQDRKQQCLQLLNQARQLLQMHNFSEALSVVESILQMEPDFVDALILKGQLLGATGRFQEALTVVNQLMQLDPDSALVWSMRAAILTNMGQLQEAKAAIDRSLALDPLNPESQAIRATILESAAQVENGQKASQLANGGDPKSFFISAGIQILALIVGAIGASILVIRPQLPIIVAFLLESSALAVLCVNAARGTYLYGAARLLLTFVISLLAAGILGGLYKFGYTWLTHKVIAFPPLIVPTLFLGFWLVAAAILPLLAALGGIIAGSATGVRRKH
jgi:tetratricopeptide (TPR) repeat protein